MAEWAQHYEGEICRKQWSGENILLFKRAAGVTTGVVPWNLPFFLHCPQNGSRSFDRSSHRH
ncbi:hypothetical protein ACLK1S_08845 [Escherichia coli]